MLVDKIIKFFASVDATHTVAEVVGIHNFNKETDNTQHINRKKTAQVWTLMTNTFPPSTIFSGTIILVTSSNWHTWLHENIYSSIDTLTNQLHSYINDAVRDKIHIIALPHLPSFHQYFQQKSIIISDFLWSQKQLHECITACKEHKIRCITIPLLTDTWIISHPLQKQYPDFFRSLY